MIHLSAILPAVARHAGVELADVLTPLRDAFWHERGMPRDFRSSKEAPSLAGSMKTDRQRIDLPEGMPYIAGVACGDNIRLTGLELAPGALWYGDMREAKLVLRRTSLPMTMVGGMSGRRIAEVVGHPALSEMDDTIIAVTENDGHTTFRLTNSMIGMADPLGRGTPRCDWIREIAEAERSGALQAA